MRILLTILLVVLLFKPGFGQKGDTSKVHWVSFNILPRLAMEASDRGEHAFGEQVVQYYKKYYLDTVNEKELEERKNLALIGPYPKLIQEGGSSNRFFRLLMSHPELKGKAIDEAMANFYLKQTLTAEEITPRILDSGCCSEAVWNNIEDSITIKYGKAIGDWILPSAKLQNYENKKDWYAFARLVDSLIVLYPPGKTGNRFDAVVDVPPSPAAGDAWGLNYLAWALFKGTDSKVLLKRALVWTELSIALEKGYVSNTLDTRANILYRLGQVKEAIEVEKKALDSDIAYRTAHGLKLITTGNDFSKTIEKMKNRVPTWD